MKHTTKVISNSKVELKTHDFEISTAQVWRMFVEKLGMSIKECYRQVDELRSEGLQNHFKKKKKKKNCVGTASSYIMPIFYA
jgi:hypothetical protein